MFIAALFTIAKIWKQPKCVSVGEWIKQLWGIYMMEYYLAIKNKKILSSVTAWMDLESSMLSETSQAEKDKYSMMSLICGISWTHWTDKQNRDRRVESGQTALGGVEGSSKKENGLMDMDNGVVIIGEGGVIRG